MKKRAMACLWANSLTVFGRRDSESHVVPQTVPWMCMRRSFFGPMPPPCCVVVAVEMACRSTHDPVKGSSSPVNGPTGPRSGALHRVYRQMLVLMGQDGLSSFKM